ncbi:hypothetical protein C8J56DRAFT_963337 [Mycena floridula]|nr:hypothetical protein C8J56DRAFT_963337 [Mycena floridula]
MKFSVTQVACLLAGVASVMARDDGYLVARDSEFTPQQLAARDIQQAYATAARNLAHVRRTAVEHLVLLDRALADIDEAGQLQRRAGDESTCSLCKNRTPAMQHICSHHTENAPKRATGIGFPAGARRRVPPPPTPEVEVSPSRGRGRPGPPRGSKL